MLEMTKIRTTTKMISTIALAVTLLSPTTSSASSASSMSYEVKHLDSHQKEVLRKTFWKAKEFDYQWTLSAIAWEESKFGKYPVNLSDPSCGAFHNLLKSVAKRVDYEVNKWNMSRICEYLIRDFDFSFSQALAELKYWENYWRSKGLTGNKLWRRTIMSYNAGFNYKKGKNYLNRILKRIYILRKTFYDNSGDLKK